MDKPDYVRELKNYFNNELHKYVSLGLETSCLDDDFTAGELRMIADVMDRWRKEIESK